LIYWRIIKKKNMLSLDDILEILRKRKADFEDEYGVTAIGYLVLLPGVRRSRIAISMLSSR
jgi:hypothetical protein